MAPPSFSPHSRIVSENPRNFTTIKIRERIKAAKLYEGPCDKATGGDIPDNLDYSLIL